MANNKTNKRKAQRIRARARLETGYPVAAEVQYKLAELDVILILRPMTNKYRVRAEKVLDVLGKDAFNTIHIDSYRVDAYCMYHPVENIDGKFFYAGIEVFKAPKDVKRKLLNYLSIMGKEMVDVSVRSELAHDRYSVFLKKPIDFYRK